MSQTDGSIKSTRALAKEEAAQSGWPERTVGVQGSGAQMEGATKVVSPMGGQGEQATGGGRMEGVCQGVID